MISISNVTVSFGSFKLLDGISFHIGDSDKIGLVGKNGAGKSTLMKLITGEEAPSSGCVEKPSGLRIGYLPQSMQHHRGVSVIEEVLSVFGYIKDMETELERLGEELARREDYESESYGALILRMNNLTDLLALEGGESPRVKAVRVLRGLGFREEELDRNTETFSQGWNMRMELAKILLGKPDVLLLDEPTNHLDIESIQWFESYLKAFRGSVLLVSHDRRFLDNVTSRTVEILLGHIHDYKVPYSRYVVLREERLAQQKAAYENQQKMIEKTEDFINRFRYKPTKSNQVQSRIKALEKLERIEIDETDSSRIKLRFPPAARSGDVVFKGTGLKVGYPGKLVFSGAGVLGQLQPLEGEARLGHNVNIGYYAQDQENVLDGRLTVLETLDRVAVGEVRTRLKDILGAFLFKGDDVDKRVSVLSGGEKARLGMARLMLSPCNVLVLDEPTNHMDIQSKDILKAALQSFDGTLIAVSHDRDFLEGLVDKVYEFRDGAVKEHLGGVEDFLRKLRLQSLQELETGAQPARKEPKPANARPAGQHSKEDRKKLNRIAALEKEVTEKEADIAIIEEKLAFPEKNADIFALVTKYEDLKQKLDALTDEWTSLMEQTI